MCLGDCEREEEISVVEGRADGGIEAWVGKPDEASREFSEQLARHYRRPHIRSENNREEHLFLKFRNRGSLSIQDGAIQNVALSWRILFQSSNEISLFIVDSPVP